jgi:hypothetical protein
MVTSYSFIYESVDILNLGYCSSHYNTLIFVVKLCVLNQGVGYWLLSNAFYSTFTLCIAMKVDVARIQTLNQLLIHGDFDSELQEFKLRMMTQIINNLSPFLAFALSYNQANVHNIMAIMLDH